MFRGGKSPSESNRKSLDSNATDLAQKFAELQLELQAKSDEADRFKFKIQLLQNSLNQVCTMKSNPMEYGLIMNSVLFDFVILRSFQACVENSKYLEQITHCENIRGYFARSMKTLRFDLGVTFRSLQSRVEVIEDALGQLTSTDPPQDPSRRASRASDIRSPGASWSLLDELTRAAESGLFFEVLPASSPPAAGASDPPPEPPAGGGDAAEGRSRSPPAAWPPAAAAAAAADHSSESAQSERQRPGIHPGIDSGTAPSISESAAHQDHASPGRHQDHASPGRRPGPEIADPPPPSPAAIPSGVRPRGGALSPGSPAAAAADADGPAGGGPITADPGTQAPGLTAAAAAAPFSAAEVLRGPDSASEGSNADAAAAAADTVAAEPVAAAGRTAAPPSSLTAPAAVGSAEAAAGRSPGRRDPYGRGDSEGGLRDDSKDDSDKVRARIRSCPTFRVEGRLG